MSYSDLRKKYGIGTSSTSEGNTANKSSGSGGYAALLKKHGISYDIDDNYINTFISDASSFLSFGQEDASSSYDSKKKAWKDLEPRYTKVRGWLYSNKHQLDEETYRSMSSFLDNLDTGASILSSFKDEEDYNFWDTHSTVEKRQAWYNDLQGKVDDLGSVYDDYFTIDLQYQEYMANPSAYTQAEAQDILSKYEKHNAYKKKYGSADAVKREIEAAEAEMRNYKRGNYNENGRYYGTKSVDDHYQKTQEDDFAITSANRDYKNPSREDIFKADAMNDISTWKWDAEGVYRDAFGNELAVDDSNTWYNPVAQQTQVEDKLALYLNTSEDERVAAATDNGVDGIWSSVMKDGYDGAWEYLDETEKGIYYAYLYEGQEKADQYLSDMKVELNRRRTLDEIGQWNKGYDEANLLEKIALNIATIPAKFGSNLAGSIENAVYTLQGEDINPYSTAQSGMHFSQTIRGNTAGELNQTGFKVPVLDLVGIDFTLGDIYQTGMSRLDSALATSVFGGGGVAFLGMGAAQDEAYRLYQQGASAEQITLDAFAAGAAEAAWEYIAFGKLEELGRVKNPGDWVKNVFIQGWNEAFEEAGTEVTNILTNALIMGSQSDLAALYQENEESAFRTFVDLVKQATHSAFGGFIGGAGAGFVQGGSSYIDTQAQYADAGKKINYSVGGSDALIKLANEVAGVSDAKLQKSLNKQVASVEKNATNRKVGKLYDTLGQAYNAQNKADIVKILQMNQFDSDNADAIADAIVALASGNITEQQAELLNAYKNNEHVKGVINSYDFDERSSIGKRNKALSDFENGVAISMMAKQYTEKAFTPEGKYAVSSTGEAMARVTEEVDGKTITKDTGEVINIKGIKEIRRGKMLLDIGDGKTIDAKNVAYANKNDALIYEAIANLGDNIDADTANRLISKFDGKNAMVFARGITQAYTYGFYGLDRSEMNGKHTLSAELTEEQRNFAYGLGEKYRPVKDQLDKAAAKVTRAPGEKGVYYRDKDGNATDIRTYLKDTKIGLKDVQKTAIEVMEKMSDMMGVRFNVFESWVENGKRYYLDENGDKVEGNPNGFYDTTTGEIYIDLNAGNDYQGTMLFTVAHELTHFMRQWSPEQFTKISQIVFQHGGMKGSVAKLAAIKQAKAKAKGKPISYDTAVEEVVADGMETILKDGKVLEFMEDVKKTDHEAWEKLKGWFKKLADFLKELVSAYKPHSAQTVEGAKVAEFAEDLLNQIKQLYAEGAVTAGDTYQMAIGKVKVSNDINMKEDSIDSSNIGIAKETKTGVKMQERTEFEAQPKQVFRVSTTNGEAESKMLGTNKSVKELRDANFKKNGFSDEEITKINGFIKEMADNMTKYRLKYKFIGLQNIYDAKIILDPMSGKIVLSAMVNNSDYSVNFDFTKICKKRVALQEVLETLAREKGKVTDGNVTEVNLTPANIKHINDILASYGVETACLCCFVESKRYNIQNYYQEKVVNVWNMLVDEVAPDAGYFNFADSDVDTSKIPDSEFAELEKQMKDWSNKTGKAKDVEQKMREFLADAPAARKKLRFSDLVTANGRTNLHKLYPEIESLILSKLGQSAPKSVEAFTPYNGEIDLLEAKSDGDIVKYLYSIAGVRSQSFSDFMIAHVFDVLQKTASMSARKMPAHVYTKEIARAILFGMTGEKHNMSVLHNVDPDVDSWSAGLSKDGEYNFSDYEAYKKGYSEFVQSIGWKDAVRLQNTEGYSKDCGIIGVGFSYNHMLKLHNDPEVRQVIGYHTSQMPVEVKPLTHLDKAADYTGVQNTKAFVGFAKPNYAIPEGVPSYATPPQDVMPKGNKKKTPKTTAVSDTFDIVGTFNKLAKGKTGDARTAAAKETLRQLLEYANDHGYCIVTASGEKGKGEFDLYGDVQATENPYLTADHYIEYCIERGMLPMFFEFSMNPNYYKDVFDFNVFDRKSYNPETGLHEDSDGRKAYAPQTAVHMLNEDGSLAFPENFFDIVDKQMSSYNSYMQDVDSKMPSIMDEVRAVTNSTSKYSYRGENQYGIEVYETSQAVMNLSWADRRAAYLDVMRNVYHGRTAKFVRNGHVYYARFDQSSIRKHIFGDKRSSPNGVKALIKAGADGDVFELVERSQYTGSQPNKKNNTDADYFDYFVKTVQIDGKVFDLVADVEKKYGVDGGYVYTLALVDNNKIKASPALGTPTSGPVKNAGNASGTKVSQPAQKVNNNNSTPHSDRDSDGNQLTAEQQKFFRDSVVRDADGNLMVMYHGTANGGAFTVFDGDKLGNRTLTSQIGQGFYFTNVKKEAESYMKNVDIYGRVSNGKNPNLHQVYLNITNPFDVNADTLDIDKVKSVYMDGTSDHFFDSYISHYLNNKTVNGRVFTKAEVQGMSKADRVSLYVDYLAQIGTKELLSNMVQAFKFNEQSKLLASMKNRLGYDGIVEEFKPGQYQYVAFSSEQIKNVDNHAPTTNPDIRYSDRDSLTPEQQKHFDYNQKQKTVGSALKTLKGSSIKRSTKFGVGKEIGGEIYFHKDYAEDILPDEVLSQALQLLEEEQPGFEYNCLKYNPKTGVVAFQEAPDFDSAREPVVGDYVSVNTNTGVVKTGHSNYIWHHKWNWVKNDYSGFDVAESWNWSKQWLSTLTEVSDGNGIERWNTQLDKFGLPHEGVMFSDREQEYDSKDTSVKILPATFTKFGLKATDRVLDWGGGQYDIAKKAVELGYPGIKFEVVDAFNRTKSHNDRILAEYAENPATVLTINNVLNVIKETDIIEDVIRESKEYLAADGVCYIKIYEGNETDGKTGNGKVTSSGWQNNQPAKWYMQFAEKYYKYVEPVGDILVASDKPINKKELPKADKATAKVMRDKVAEIRKEEPSMRESLYSYRDTIERAKEHFGLTTDFAEAGFILPSGEMLKFTDDKHRGERQFDHRAIGIVYGVDVDLNVNHGFNEESGKFMDEFVEKGGIRFDAGDPDLDMDIGLQLSSTVPITKEQKQLIRDLVEWKQNREELYEASMTEESFLYDGPLAIRIDFGGNSKYATGSVSSKDLDAWGVKHLTYEGGQINADRIIADIRHYYKTGETRKPSTIAQFRFSDRDNVGYHAGDLGKSEDFDAMTGAGRATGHFGTGTYFVGDEAQISDSFYGNRPHEKVNFDKYNLFKVQNYEEGSALHSFLKSINDNILHLAEARKTFDEYYDSDKNVMEAAEDTQFGEWSEDEDVKNNRKVIDEYIESNFTEGEKQRLKEAAEKEYDRAQNATVSEYWKQGLEADYNRSVKYFGKIETLEEYVARRVKDREESIADSKKLSVEDWYYSQAYSFLKEHIEASEIYRDWYRGLTLRAMKSGVWISEDKLRSILDSIYDTAKGYGYDGGRHMDSPSTMFIKALGYEGIDVRGVKGLDNSTYGSVIYDLKGEDLVRKQTIGTARFQDRDSDSVSNRSLLANALEGAVKKGEERNLLRNYKTNLRLINSEEQKLRELNEQIRELSFAKGPRDTKKIKDLQFEAKQTASRINTYDKELLKIESMQPIKDVLEREKKVAYKKAEQRGKDALAAYKEKTAKTQRELLNKWQESRKKGIENREKTAMRHKIQSVVGELNQLLLSNDKKRHVPDSLKKAVADALALVNMDTVGAEERAAKYAALIAKESDPDKIDAYTATMENILRQGEKMGQRLKELRDAYEEIQNSDDPDIANAYDPVIAGSLQELAGSIGNTSLRDMTIEQLQDVYDMYRMVLTRVRDANKTFLKGRTETISGLASRVVGEVKKVGGEHKYRAAILDFVKKFGWDNLKPVYAFEHLGSGTLTDVFNGVRAGEDVWAVDVSEAREYYLDKSKKHGYDSWDFKKKYRFKSASELDFELTLEQILSLYAYSKREQAHDHLRLGGFVFDSNIETYKEDGSKLIKYKVNTADAHQITPEILAKIIGTLSDEQKTFVDEMQDYLSTVMGAKGNEVTMQMYGVKLFKEKFYFPLKSAKQFMFEQNEVSGEVRIKNSGFTNKVVAKANNPVILSNFMDVWAGHVNDMSMYHAFVLPLEDFNRVFNYNSPKQEGQPPVSVKGTIQNAYGPSAVGYVRQLITDLNGGARSDSTTGIINKLIGLFKKGSVFASLSVVVQQPSAIARAAALVDTKYFIGPKVDRKRHKALWEEVKKYAPVAIIKEMGYFDTNMGKSTQDFITGKEYSGFKEKMNALVTDSNYRDEVLSKAPALADELAWCGIWEAVKRETQAKNPGMDVKSEEFLKKAGERFTEVVTKTQVYDSILSRSGMMRSKDTGMKMATAFMAEPTTSINMVADALLQGKRGNKKYAVAAIGAVIASQILNSILVSFVYAGRDDDEDETYLEKYIGTLSGEVLDSLNPAGYIPFIKDIMSIVQGYDVERSDMAVISDLWNAIKNLSNDKVSAYRKVEGFAGSVAQIFGLPVKNIMRDARGIYQTVMSFMSGQKTTAAGIGYAVKGAITGKDVSDSQQLYEAYMSGDATQIARVKGRFKDQDAVNSAIRKALRENDPRIKEAAIAWNANDLDEYMRIAKKIIAEKHFAQDDVVMAIRSEANALAPDAETETQSKAKGLFTAKKFAEAIAQGDQATANAIKVDIIQTAQKNGKTEEEAEESFASSAKSELKELFLAGKISEDKLVDALVSYFDMDESEAELKAESYAWEDQGYEGATSAAVRDYNTYCATVAVPKDVYLYIRQFSNNTENDKDASGKSIAYSAMKKVIAEINAQAGLTPAQKTAIARSLGWAEKNIQKYKTW